MSIIDTPWDRIPKTLMLPISSIRRDGGTQQRALGMNRSHVESLLLVIRMAKKKGSGFNLFDTPFEPIAVYDDGENLWLADGHHRVAAYMIEGLTSIPADVRQGSRRDAILHSCRSNSSHGLPRTNEDKRKAVETVLKDPYWSQYSDLQIADMCMVSDWLVRKISREMRDKGAAPRTAHRISRRGTRFDSQPLTESGKVVAKKSAETKARRKIEKQKITDEDWLSSIETFRRLKNEGNESGFRRTAIVWKRLDELGVFEGVRKCAKALGGDEQSIASAVLALYNTESPEKWEVCPECKGSGWSDTEDGSGSTAFSSIGLAQCGWCNNSGGFVVL